MIRFATIGSGKIVEQFLTEAKKHPEFQLAAVYSRTPERAAEFALQWGATLTFTDLQALADCPEVDAVYIASPNLCHAEQAITLMKAGKHILCEKPMATTYIDCDGMVLQAHNSRVILLEGMRPLFTPGFRRLHELIPEIGTLRRITAGYCRYSSRYDSYLAGGRPNAFDPRLNNAAVADLGVYCIAPTIALAGEPERVASFCSKLGEFEAQGAAIAQYPGFLAEWRWSKIADSPLPSAIEGENGAILIGRWDTMSPLTLCLRGQEPKEIPPEDDTSALYAELDAFITMIKRRGGNEAYLSISLATCRVLDEIAKQNKITFRQTCWNMVVHRDE